MKPISETNDFRRGRNFVQSRRRPWLAATDCNFQAFAHNRYHGGAGSSQPSFLNISHAYFRYEARRNFIMEVGFFLVIAAIFAASFISSARAIIHFLHLPAA